MIPTIDFETRSAAGYVWDEEEERWTGPPGAAESGLALVGVKNYVAHPTFKVLSLSYGLGDSQGVHLWLPGMPNPRDLLRHVALRGVLSGWNIGQFEMEVWNAHCVKEFGWPPLILEQLTCDMAAARAWSLPGKLADAGAVLNLAVQKDANGDRLIKKFTVPRQPTKNNKAMWHESTDPEGPPPKAKKEKPGITAADAAAYQQYQLRMQEWRDKGMIDDDIPF